MHLAPLIQDLALILGVAGLMSVIFRKIKQPVVLGYILAGVVVGPYTPPFQLVTDIPSIQIWAELGVIFLMFSLGLEFSFRKLARVGASASITAVMEVAFFIPVGFILGKILGWSSIDSLFMGAMLSISSTTIIIKALDELNLKTHRFAELIFAVLIVEDLIAILLLVALSTIAGGAFSGVLLLSAGVKLVLVVGGWFLTGYIVVPRFMRYVSKIGNNEMLTILSLGLCLGLVVFATHFQYSTALGAFIMGSILAESSVLRKIEERMESLRDLFGAIFFVSIGMLINPQLLWEHRWTVALLSAVTIIGKIVSTSFGALLSGQTFRNSVQVGFGLAQIGEFSFIIASLGLSLKVNSEFLYPVAVAVSLVTTFTTPYLIKVSGPAAVWLEKMLPKRAREGLNAYAVWTEQRRTGVGQRESWFTLLLRWVRDRIFLSDDEKEEGSRRSPAHALRRLAPWDAHLVRIEVHPNSAVVKKSLAEAAFRNRFGVNVVAIQRGEETIVAPKPDEIFLPKDELVVLGTDNQVDLVKKEIETPESGKKIKGADADYELRQLHLEENSPFQDKTIRQSAIREKYHAMVVGVERAGKRNINPDSDLRLKAGDTLWIVGERSFLDKMSH